MGNNKGHFKKGHKINSGRIPWNKNIKTGIIPNTAFKKGDNIGIKNHEWKGDKVGYRVLHHWVKRWLGGKATKCNYKNCIYPRKDSHGRLMISPKAYHWANISGEYKRDLVDWIQLCSSCHSLYDHGKITL